MTLIHRYKNIALGGTFDHFHIGHQHFLRIAAQHADHVVIGITNQHLTQQKEYSFAIQDLSARRTAVEAFCQNEDISYTLVVLEDVFGPTLTDPTIEALAVTEFTVLGAKKINHARKERGLSILPLVIASMVTDAHGQVINSTRIRAGEINREGFQYRQLFIRNQVISPHQHQVLQQPFGTLVSQPNPAPLRYIVGDQTAKTFLDQGWQFQGMIIDGHTQRSQAVELPPLSLLTDEVVNPPGIISSDLAAHIKQKVSSSQPWGLMVNGEEDLAAVPLLLLAPLQSRVYYGEKDQGIREIVVTEAMKQQLQELFFAK